MATVAEVYSPALAAMMVYEGLPARRRTCISLFKNQFIHLKISHSVCTKAVLIPTDWGSEKMLCILPDQNRQLNQINETNGCQVAEDREG